MIINILCGNLDMQRTLLFVFLMFVLFCLMSDSFAQSTSKTWVETSKSDLISAHDILNSQTVFAIGPENNSYKKWLKEGFLRALKLSAKVKSFVDYQYVMRYYINGFHDAHISIRFNAEKIAHLGNIMQWPGFLVRYKDGLFVVQSKNKTFLKENHVPPNGSRLLECDGEGPKALMAKNVFPYLGNKNLVASYLMMTRKLMMYDGNSFLQKLNECKFVDKQKTYDVSLNWKRITKSDWRFIKYQDYHPPNLHFEIKNLSKNIVILTVPTFGLFSAKSIFRFNQFLKKIHLLRNKANIVIDLRGNDGGDSLLGDKILSALYGPYSWRKKISREKTQYELWRATDNNLQFIEKVAIPWAGRKYKTSGANYKYYISIKKAIRHAIKSGGKLAKVNIFTKKQISEFGKQSESLFRGNLFLLTDRMCVSACLNFIDDALGMPNTKLIGEPTSADTAYIDNRSTALPSGNAQISFPMKYIYNRKRKTNQPYIPEYYYSGNIVNTHLVDIWIMNLLQKDD